jgi:hypothetical protein
MAGAGSTYWSTTETKSLATTVGWESIGYDENALYVEGLAELDKSVGLTAA